MALGTALVAFGLVLVAGASARGSAGLLVGGLLAVLGVTRLVTAAGIDEVRTRAHPADAHDPRWHGGVSEIQLAGRPCVECKKKITLATEGVACHICAAPAHAACDARHRARTHRPASTAPFR